MTTPLLSIIVIVHDMPRQALNTLRSLSAGYQRDVVADDYEVIVVENRSPRTIDPAALAALPGRFRHVLRDEAGVSPAAAINAGLAFAQGRQIGLMIDGARMVTPGVIALALAAARITPHALTLVPGYHLGDHEHQFHATHGHSEERERELLRGIDWEHDGYRLFDIACLSGANRHGIFHPFLECNCMVLPAGVMHDLGGADERFDLPGGGGLNLALYRRAALHPQTRLFVLPGEGSFHQLHGGVTTSEVEGRQQLLDRIRDQLHELLGEPFTAPRLQPSLLGSVGGPALRHLRFSVEEGLTRHRTCAAQGRDPHADEILKRTLPRPALRAAS